MTTTTFNSNLKSFNFSTIEMSELNLQTYTIKYHYYNTCNWFEKEIPAESIEEAILDAKDWIKEKNATIGNCHKTGNYIDIAFVSKGWDGQRTAITF